tara:strand:- start:1763 stop:2347 length:585 start_codon:yes stop_codon:yes gene_type:complete
MIWKDIIKASYSNKNLPMLKKGIEKVYLTIPAGTIFTSSDYYEKFMEVVEPMVGSDNISRRTWSVWSKGKGRKWFPNYFTNFGLRRGYAKVHNKAKYKLIRLDDGQDYYKESLMKGRRRRFQFGKNLDNIMRDGKERTAKEAFLSLQDYYINKPDRSGGNIPTTAEVSGYLNSVAYKRYEKIKGRPNKYRWIGE